jgi:hypothetical protein
MRRVTLTHNARSSLLSNLQTVTLCYSGSILYILTTSILTIISSHLGAAVVRRYTLEGKSDKMLAFCWFSAKEFPSFTEGMTLTVGVWEQVKSPFRPNSEEVTEKKKLRDKDFQHLYIQLDIVASRRMKWTGHVARMKVITSAHILVRKCKKKRI